MPFELGPLTVHQVRDGTIALDGGAMFGVVPKPLWERACPADARNRVTLALRCMLVVEGNRRILVDDGIGVATDAGVIHFHRVHRDPEIQSVLLGRFSALTDSAEVAQGRCARG